MRIAANSEKNQGIRRQWFCWPDPNSRHPQEHTDAGSIQAEAWKLQSFIQPQSTSRDLQKKFKQPPGSLSHILTSPDKYPPSPKETPFVGTNHLYRALPAFPAFCLNGEHQPWSLNYWQNKKKKIDQFVSLNSSIPPLPATPLNPCAALRGAQAATSWLVQFTEISGYWSSNGSLTSCTRTLEIRIHCLEQICMNATKDKMIT